jgi:hypothetical protein
MISAGYRVQLLINAFYISCTLLQRFACSAEQPVLHSLRIRCSICGFLGDQICVMMSHGSCTHSVPVSSESFPFHLETIHCTCTVTHILSSLSIRYLHFSCIYSKDFKIIYTERRFCIYYTHRIHRYTYTIDRLSRR